MIDEKELKRIKKEEKKKILKARDIIGTNYVIIIGLIDFIPLLIFEESNSFLVDFLYLIWYIILPLVGAYLLVKFYFKKLKKYITPNNYKRIKNSSIFYLILIGIFHVGFNFNILFIPILIPYIVSCVYVIKNLDKIYKEICLND